MNFTEKNTVFELITYPPGPKSWLTKYFVIVSYHYIHSASLYKFVYKPEHTVCLHMLNQVLHNCGLICTLFCWGLCQIHFSFWHNEHDGKICPFGNGNQKRNPEIHCQKWLTKMIYQSISPLQLLR
jgi:hypothetical protein